MKATTQLVLMAACLMLLSTAPAMAVDCTVIRAACVERCQTLAPAQPAGLADHFFLQVITG
jgi:hypothetical protein